MDNNKVLEMFRKNDFDAKYIMCAALWMLECEPQETLEKRFGTQILVSMSKFKLDTF